jgi:uncharacterized membrane protein
MFMNTIPEPTVHIPEKTIYRIFKIGIIGKGIFALLDIIAALSLYFFGTGYLTRIVAKIAQGELLEDPGDGFGQFFLYVTSNFSSNVTTFVTLYLLVHGIINAVYVVGLLRERRWAYGFAMVSMSAFLLYQVYRLSHAFSPWLFMLTLFDVGIMLLIWHEYRYRYGEQ